MCLAQRKHSINASSGGQILCAQKGTSFLSSLTSLGGMWLKSGLSESFSGLFQWEQSEEDLFSPFPRL